MSTPIAPLGTIADPSEILGSPIKIPRLPVMSWQAFSGKQHAALPCLLDAPGLQMTTSGRASILLAMELLGLGVGDKVLLPTYHCPTMIAPVVAVGAIPVFYPIDCYGVPQLDWLKQQSLDGVKAILAAHYFGVPRPMRALRDWCDVMGIALIEDCAHSLFGTSESRRVGQWGDIAIGSLTKFLPVPEGGCMMVNAPMVFSSKLQKPTLMEQIRALVDILHVAASFNRLTGLNRVLMGAFSLRQTFKRGASGAQTLRDVQEDQPTDGFTIDSSLAHRALTWASSWVTKRAPRARIVRQRRRHFAELVKSLSGYEGLRPLVTHLPEGAAPYVFPLWVAEPDPGYQRMRLLGIPVSRWDRLWPGVPQIPDDFGVNWSHNMLQLACHQDLSDADIQTIASTVIKLYAQNALPANQVSAPG